LNEEMKINYRSHLEGEEKSKKKIIYTGTRIE
jgi:hypothetical protein